MVTVLPTTPFAKKVKKIKDASIKERIKKQIAKIIENPEVGKPLGFSRKGERALRVTPFRIIYTIDGDKILLLNFDNRETAYD